MRRNVAAGVVGVCLHAGVAYATGATVVTGGTPPVQASMQLVLSGEDGSTWLVTGKARPALRAAGASVNLVCQTFAEFQNGNGQAPPLKFPPRSYCNLSEGVGGPGCVDGCGNFAFTVTVPGASPQFGPEYFCAFVVNRPEGTVATPQSCNGKTASPDELAADPTQAATCTGGACPDSP